MASFKDDIRVKNLNSVYKESGCRSILAFSKRVNAANTTTRNYLLGDRVPDMDFLMNVIKEFPEYNLDWIAYGKGDKFNKDYVTERQYDPEEIEEERRNASMYERIISTLKERINDLTKLCDSKDEQIKLLTKMVEDSGK